jgi:hypothetical protein
MLKFTTGAEKFGDQPSEDDKLRAPPVVMNDAD